MRVEVNGYSVSGAIGTGGFSTVYLAHQDQFDRSVALKVLNICLSDDAAVRRFRNECLALGRLDAHPHIADVYAAGVSADDQPYIAMRLYRQGSLADALARQGSLPIDDVLRVGIQTADALDAAHSLGIVHRDVKPQNILVTDRGDVALSDFGVSLVEYQAGSTVTQAFTYDHVAPEILESEEFGPASDQYALASTLYLLATGRCVFPARATAQRVRAIAHEAPDLSDPRLLAIAPILKRALEKDPAARYPSMKAMVEDLRCASLAASQAPDPPSTSNSSLTIIKPVARAWSSRSRWTLPSVAGAILIAIVTLSAVSRWLMFTIEGTGIPADGEWLSFQGGLFLIAGFVAATLIQIPGALRSIGYGVALYVLASRFKILSGSLLTASKEERIPAVYLWLLLLALVSAGLVVVALSAWRYRVARSPSKLSQGALTAMILTAAAGGAYTFWAWSVTVKDVGEFAVLCVFVALIVGVSLYTILCAYRFDSQLGLVGYAGSFFILHGFYILGVWLNLASGKPRMAYELPLLLVLGVAFSLALLSAFPRKTATASDRSGVVDLRSQPSEARQRRW